MSLTSRHGEPLTEREVAVLIRIADGMDAFHIGLEMYLSPATIKAHLKHIYQKLGANNAAHAVAIAYHQGILRARVEV